MIRKIVLLFSAALSVVANAQTLAPVTDDALIQFRTPVGTLTSRYITTDKTGALQLLLIGQDPTPGAPVGSLMPQRRLLGPSIVCGTTATSACDVVATAVTIGSSQINDASAIGRALLTSVDASGARSVISAPSVSDLSSGLAGKAATVHTHVTTDITDTSASGRAFITAADYASQRGLLGVLSASESNAAYYPLSGNPSGFLTSITSAQVTGALGFTPYNATNPSGFITSSALSPYLTSATAASTYATSASMTTALAAKADSSAMTTALAAKQNSVTLTTTGSSGAATFNPATGALNIPNYAPGTGTVTSVTAGTGLSGGTITNTGTISMPNVGTAGTYNQVTTDAQGRVTAGANVKFDFSQPNSRTLAVSTSYQALDPTKAAIIIPSYACQNATQVLASSGCTIQVRMGTGTLTCSTGTIYYTQSLTVNLGVLITQNSTNPVQINLPIGGSFILCPQTGTFSTTTVEQSAG